MIGQYAELDAAITEFKKVSDLTGQSLDNYVQKLGQIGSTVGRTTSEMVEAATQFKKNSYNEEDSAQLALIAARYQNVADTSISAADSASFIISQMKAFGIEAENAGIIIDKVNEVANNFAVGTNDLSNALEVAGAGLSTYNNSIDQTIGLVTAGSEIMTGRSLQVARGLNTIAARLVKNQDLLAKYGISLNNADGSMKSTYEVLSELSQAWARMGDEERTTVGTAIAGINQYKVLAAVMTNFQSATNAVEVSLRSQGSAAKENEKYMESFEAKMNGLRAAWQNLSTAFINDKGIKGIITKLTNFIEKIAESESSMMALKVAFGSAFTFGAVQLLGVTKILPVLKSQFKDTISIIKLLGEEGGGLTAFLDGFVGYAGVLPTIMSNLAPILLAVGAAIGVVALTIKGVKDTLYTLSLDYELDLIRETESQLESQEKELSKLENATGTLTEREQNRLDVLRDQTKELRQQRQDQLEEAKRRFIREGRNPLEYTETMSYREGNTIEVTKNYVAVLENLNKKLDEGTISEADYAEQLIKIRDNMQQDVDTIKMFDDAEIELTDDMQNALDVYNSIVAVLETYYLKLDKGTQSTLQFGAGAFKAGKYVLGLADAIAQASKMGNGEYDSAFQGYAKSFDTLQKEFEAGRIGSKALDEALQGLVDTETYAAFTSGTFAEKSQLLKEIMPQLTTMFGDAESGGLGYLTAMKNIANSQGEVIDSAGNVAATISKVGGKTQYAVNDFQGLADALDVSYGALFAMTEASKVFGYDFKYDVEDIAKGFQSMGVEIEKVGEGAYNIDISQMTQALSEWGMSAEEISAVTEAFETMDGITLTSVKKEEDEVDEKAQEAKDSLNDINNLTFDSAVNNLGALITQLNAVKTAANEAAAAVAGVGGAGGEADANATGTSNFKGGLALVNDGAKVNGSAKELIVDNGRAFMMPTEPALVNLDKGATIYTAKETQSILGGIPAFAMGIGTGGGGGGFPPAPPISGVTEPPDEEEPEVPLYRRRNGGGGGRRGMTDEEAKKAFEKWLKEEKHLLAMDEITEEQYYDDLEEMMEKYLANRQSLIEEYWKYEEEVYKYRKKALEDVIDLEERLNDLARAKTQKVLVYKDGMFQYVNNVEAIANAQNALAKALSKNAGASADLGGGFGTDMTAKIATIGTSGDTFNIGEVTLSDVTNVNDIFDGLKNLAIQQSAK